MKRKFVNISNAKYLEDVEPPPQKPTYAGMWRKHNEVLRNLFATPHSFYGWAQRYNYGEIPPLETVISDRVIQLGEVV